MLSAVLAVLVGVVLAVVRSHRRNLREVAEGRRGYRPAPGLIGWNDAGGDGSGSEA